MDVAAIGGDSSGEANILVRKCVELQDLSDQPGTGYTNK